MIFWGKTKNGMPHAVPLPRQAAEVIEAIAPIRHGLFFGNRFRPDEPAEYGSFAYLIKAYVTETGAARFTSRDARRTWKTLAGRAGIPKEMRDRLQNHARGGDVSSRHYDRYDYLLEKRAVMAKWSAYLDRLIAGTAGAEPADNVAQLAAVRGADDERPHSPLARRA
jgi:hypothetical protein